MFVAYDVAIALLRHLRAIIALLESRDRDLADQLRRASSSVALNLAEGRNRRGGDRRRLYSYAHGSAGEIRAVLDVVTAFGWGDFPQARQELDRLLGLLWGLTH